MKDLKESWNQYELEKELQIVPVESVNTNEARMKELQKALIFPLLPTVDKTPETREINA